ncbi:EscU/YscU/HrcU family type III secretion system export apparatus switch protein [Thalassococcus sp. S3]|uniref:EscU/YscU/HrcU family type III secretion system export apparatus switch protein n=1 Tax=Thalassococcus sp. S3 TaxID=2017482 RepID=UPI0010246771|nr:EscU/YscU/HrcU family type III secretion system export apparatus switch protein [Thalassococcus sp. S3]QBF33402.1 hypothetical protein CFI11_19620 [Thalassococcus sp. S3]
MSSEEKTEAATPKKLKDARGKGQIAQYQDLSIGLGFLVGIAVILARAPALFEELAETIVVTTASASEPFDAVVLELAIAYLNVAMNLLIPLLAAIVGQLIIGKIVVNQGIVFSLDPLTPRLQNLSPIAGVKRIFGKMAIVAFVKTLLKLVLLGATCWVISNGAVGTLIHLPPCGLDCTLVAIHALTQMLLFAMAAIVLVIGALDMPVQKHLFLDQQKMTKTETKMEQKNIHGSPEIKQEQNRLRREMSQGPAQKLGIKQATLVIYHEKRAIGIRYVEGDTPIPVVVSRSANQTALKNMRSAFERATPFYYSTTLADTLASKCAPGQLVPSDLYGEVARAIHLGQLPEG